MCEPLHFRRQRSSVQKLCCAAPVSSLHGHTRLYSLPGQRARARAGCEGAFPCLQTVVPPLHRIWDPLPERMAKCRACAPAPEARGAAVRQFCKAQPLRSCSRQSPLHTPFLDQRVVGMFRDDSRCQPEQQASESPFPLLFLTAERAGREVLPLYTRARTAGSSADVWTTDGDEAEEKRLNQIPTTQSTAVLDEGTAGNWMEGNLTVILQH